MKLAPETRLAHFKVSARLGSGAMGEVWRATDTTLGREVAIKVLPDEFVRDPERLARFEREARVLASLEHSRIASIYGFEDVEDTKFLVMQLAEGEDLSARLERGAIALEEALPIALQIADGLDAAHERGVVHRDLKPANIMVDSEGNVRILDFGLALAIDSDGTANSDLTSAPTMAQATTQAGAVLGTAAYMSPEQARGKTVDKRTDIWAFGVVLWEMLTGDRLFHGETLSDTLAAVLTRDPDLSALPEKTPLSVRRLIGRCLDHNPRQRLRDIGEATLVLEAAIKGDVESAEPSAAESAGARLSASAGWIVASVLLVALVAMFLTLTQFRTVRSKTERMQAMSLEVVLIEDKVLSQSLGASAVVSPDGTLIAFVAGDSPNLAGTARAADVTSSSETQLYLRRLDDLTATPLRRTESAISPFFSPDGQWIGFFSEGKLKKIAISGGRPRIVCDAADPRGGTWGAGDVIVFTPTTESGLSRVSAAGGEPQPLTVLDHSSRERSHRWPSFLPDGHNVVFTAQIHQENYEDGKVRVVDARNGSVVDVHDGGAYPRVTPTNHLTWIRDGSLFAAPFDTRTMTKTVPARVVIESLMSLTANEAMDDGTGHYDFSTTGQLLYRSGSPSTRRSFLVWFDRQGNEISRRQKVDYYRSPTISPDGSRVAVTILGQDNDIFIWELQRDLMRLLTAHNANEQRPVWSPDGNQVVFLSPRDAGAQNLYTRAADGSGEARLFAKSPSSNRIQPSSWSSDGQTFLAHELEEHRFWKIIAFPVADGVGGEAETLISSRSADSHAEISPDGKWITYMKYDAGRSQIYLQAYPMTGKRWQVSPQTGGHPSWTRDGTEIVYHEATGRLVAVSIDTSSEVPTIGPPELLFQTSPVEQTQFPNYDVSSDGNRFIITVVEDDPEEAGSNVILVTNWFEQLESAASGSD